MEDMENSPYEPLGRGNNANHRSNRRQHLDSIDSPEISSQPPGDRHNALYTTLFATAVSFIMPYNCFILSSDYWQSRFPDRTVALDMSMTYIIVAFCTVLLNNVFLSLFSFKMRVMFGYTVSLITLMFVAFCEMAWHLFTTQTTYSVNLAAISLTAVGCTVQQSSFYGFASMFPKKYTQALMAGESFAGFLVATNRIITKSFVQDEETSTIVFFLASSGYIAMSFLLQTYSFQLPYVRYHMKACSKIILRPDEDRVLAETLHDGSVLQSTARCDFLTLDANSPAVTATTKTTSTTVPPIVGLSFSNPVYELSNPSAGESTLDGLNNYSETLLMSSSSTPSILLPQLGDQQTTLSQQQQPAAKEQQLSSLQCRDQHTTSTTNTNSIRTDVPNVVFKVEHILTPNSCSAAATGRLGNFRSGIESRWRVAHAIYPYMVSIALAYCVTLSLYPGIESEIVSCKLKSWMPVLLMLTFNTSDLMGKIIAAIPYGWSRRQLILMAGLRALLIPLLLLCCSPRKHPIIAGETPAFIFSAALGITNGLSGSLPMMLAPSKVPATLKEVTGNMMTLSYNVGLTLGSLIGYIFELMLGPQIRNPCPEDLYVNRQTTTATTTAAATTLATLTAPTPSPSQPTVNAPPSAILLSAITVASTLSNKINNSITTILNNTITTIMPTLNNASIVANVTTVMPSIYISKILEATTTVTKTSTATTAASVLLGPSGLHTSILHNINDILKNSSSQSNDFGNSGV